jgi:tetratricopeptide (TPR) repeat protein
VIRHIAFVLAVAAGGGCGREPGRSPAPEQDPRPRHVLLITIDTLRADRLGCYGYAAARTPTLDALARRGTRFSRAYTTAPITLPAHATILSGRYPPRHGARHNGIAMPATTPSLAEAFDQAGFDTSAFVSAFPLDQRFGLTRGFDVYDDELPRQADGRRAVERAGSVTIDRAIAWLRTRNASSRLFAWIHLFEPHAPYGTPGSGSQRGASSRYDQDIAAADREVGRLLQAWPDLPATLVVATADHGEAFGEHGENGHSIFVYDATLRVPLVLAGPRLRRGVVVGEPVTLADLAPTIAAAIGLPRPDADGIDLRPLLEGARIDSRALYAESFAPLFDFGWSPLRSLRRGQFKFIAAPEAELYDLEADRDEARNVIGRHASAASELAAAIEGISGPQVSEPRSRADADALARLRALGYASGGSGRGESRPDPKHRIGVASTLALVTSGELQGAAAERALREVLRDDPRNGQAQERLGFILADTKRCPEAERYFAAAIAGGLPSADPFLGLAMCRMARGAVAEALSTLEAARRVEPGNPVVDANIGLASLQRGHLDAAVAALRRALAIDPDLHLARFALARALARRGARGDALREAEELLRRLPASAPQRPEVERLVRALR